MPAKLKVWGEVSGDIDYFGDSDAETDQTCLRYCAGGEMFDKAHLSAAVVSCPVESSSQLSCWKHDFEQIRSVNVEIDVTSSQLNRIQLAKHTKALLEIGLGSEIQYAKLGTPQPPW